MKNVVIIKTTGGKSGGMGKRSLRSLPMWIAKTILGANRHSRHPVEDPPRRERRFAGYLGLAGLDLGLSLLVSPLAFGQCLYEATILWGPQCSDGSLTGLIPTSMDEQGNAAGASSCFLAIHATVWTGSGLALPLPDSGESRPFAMTDPDHIVGTDVPTGASLGVASLWEFGNLILLGTLPGDEFSKAHGINSNMQIVGLSSGSSSGGSFIWENGEFSTLSGFPVGTVAFANDINDEVQIVGSMDGSSSISNAFIWENGIVTDLGNIPGGTSATAVAISSIGHVVGAGAIPMEGTIFGIPHAFFWDGESMIDLGVLSGKVESLAYDLNDADQIVGA